MPNVDKASGFCSKLQFSRATLLHKDVLSSIAKKNCTSQLIISGILFNLGSTLIVTSWTCAYYNGLIQYGSLIC
jgi:hypothetical protein